MLIFDLVLLVILLLCVAVGLRKGFILTLCSLLAVVVALVGARFAADQYAPAMTQAIAPRIEAVISDELDRNIDKTVENMTGENAKGEGLTGILGILQRGGLYTGAITDIQNAIQSGVHSMSDSVAASMAQNFAQPISWGAVYSLSFSLILLLWYLLSQLLNQVVKLPGLRTFNRVLGGVCGLVKGLIIVSIVSCLILYLGLLPAELCRDSVFLQFFSFFTKTSL